MDDYDARFVVQKGEAGYATDESWDSKSQGLRERLEKLMGETWNQNQTVWANRILNLSLSAPTERDLFFVMLMQDGRVCPEGFLRGANCRLFVTDQTSKCTIEISMTLEEDEPVYRVSDDRQSFHLDANPFRVNLKNDSVEVNANGRVTMQISRQWCGFDRQSEAEGFATYRLQVKPFFRGLRPCTCHLVFPSWTRVEQLPTDYTLKEETEAEKIWYEIMSRTRLYMGAFDVVRLKVEVRKESFEFIKEADNMRAGYSREVSRAWEAALSILGHYIDAGFMGALNATTPGSLKTRYDHVAVLVGLDVRPSVPVRFKRATDQPVDMADMLAELNAMYDIGEKFYDLFHRHITTDAENDDFRRLEAHVRLANEVHTMATHHYEGLYEETLHTEL